MSGTLRRWFNLYLAGWLVGALGATATHLLRAETEAAESQWLSSPGWQREIGLFNLAIAFIIVQVLRRDDDDSRRMMARTGVFISVLLGANHVAALVGADGPTRLHWTAIGLNLLNGGVSSSLLYADRRRLLARGNYTFVVGRQLHS